MEDVRSESITEMSLNELKIRFENEEKTKLKSGPEYLQALLFIVCEYMDDLGEIKKVQDLLEIIFKSDKLSQMTEMFKITLSNTILKCIA